MNATNKTTHTPDQFDVFLNDLENGSWAESYRAMLLLRAARAMLLLRAAPDLLRALIDESTRGSAAQTKTHMEITAQTEAAIRKAEAGS